MRVTHALGGLAHAVGHIEGIAEADVEACWARYRDEVAEAHRQIVEIVEALPPEERILVTNHGTLAYFAERYGFHVLGTVIPSTSTAAAPSIAHLEALSDLIADTGVAAIFGEMSHPSKTAQSLGDELGVAVVPLATEILGDPEGPTGGTYIGLILNNARAIVAALQPSS